MYMKTDIGKHPMEVLGDKYMEERQKEVFDLSSIRYAQGEIYYLNKDYETAIFKWENIPYDSELYQWARKNIADAHAQLEFLAIAEEYYKEIETENLVLQMDIYLRLFQLYLRRNKLREAEETIQQAIALDPDFHDVTKKARAFYEKEENFDKALDLAIREAIRTKSITWFQVMKAYVEKGFVLEREPSYFLPSLEVLYKVDHELFEQLTLALWNYYMDTAKYFSWLRVWNDMFLRMEGKELLEWKAFTTLFKTTYQGLTDGNYVMDQISAIIPKLITNGFKVTKGEEKKYFSAIIIAWNEKHPFQIDQTIIEEANDYLSRSTDSTSKLEDIIDLFEAMTNWAKTKEIEMDAKLTGRIRRQQDTNHYYALIGGADTNELVHSEAMNLLSTEKLEYPLFQCKIPLNHYKKVEWMNPPEILDIQLADFILYVLNKQEDIENVIKLKDKEEVTNREVYFFVNEALISKEDIVSKIKVYFPNAFIQFYSERTSTWDWMMKKLTQTIKRDHDLRHGRGKRLLSSMKDFIPFLMDKRKEIEGNLLDAIERDEEIAEMLYQAIRQLYNLQDEKIQTMKYNYRLIIRELRSYIQKEIPRLLADCSNLVTVDSDFENIHVQLNEVMNKRMVTYVEDEVYPQFKEAFSEWIIESERQLKDSITSLDEISASFNHMYGEEKMTFVYDLLVLDDWKRDADRMSRGSVPLDKVNILMRSASSQFFVKGAGKLFGTIPIKNRNVFYKKYQQFIENKDYNEIAKSVADRVLQQYEYFEVSIERDMEMFFSHAFDTLQVLLQDTEKKMDEEKQLLYEMTNQPEYYEDPIKLFELHVRQLEKLIFPERMIQKL